MHWSRVIRQTIIRPARGIRHALCCLRSPSLAEAEAPAQAENPEHGAAPGPVGGAAAPPWAGIGGESDRRDDSGSPLSIVSNYFGPGGAAQPPPKVELTQSERDDVSRAVLDIEQEAFSEPQPAAGDPITHAQGRSPDPDLPPLRGAPPNRPLPTPPALLGPRSVQLLPPRASFATAAGSSSSSQRQQSSTQSPSPSAGLQAPSSSTSVDLLNAGFPGNPLSYALRNYYAGNTRPEVITTQELEESLPPAEEPSPQSPVREVVAAAASSPSEGLPIPNPNPSHPRAARTVSSDESGYEGSGEGGYEG